MDPELRKENYYSMMISSGSIARLLVVGLLFVGLPFVVSNRPSSWQILSI
jgi:hypothetical protein